MLTTSNPYRSQASHRRRSWSLSHALATLLLCSPWVLTATEQETADTPPPAPEILAKELSNPTTFGAYLDGEVQARMDKFGVVGVVLAVVKDGELYYSQGYGLADRENNTPVDVNTTLFRPGSISKTFTWTAIMQLVEQGKIDLNADISSYLTDIPIANTYAEPIKVKHLLSHTPGFEAPGLGHLFENDPKNVLSLKEYLKKYVPARVRPPGQLYTYSNYGTALAGHIIATVSGMPYEDYMQQFILGPLGMHNSSFREPLGEDFPNNMPKDLADRVSKGFTGTDDGYYQGNFTYISGIGPAGALSATAPDMAKFMMAHLGRGQANGATILQPQTADLMHSPSYYYSSGKAVASAHGFVNYPFLGHNRLGHDGGTVHFESQMGIYPELNFGIFISTNTRGGAALHAEIEKLLIERYFGDTTNPVIEITPPAASNRDYEKFVGTYQSTRRVYSNIESMLSMLSGVLEIEASDNGYLIAGGSGGPKTQLVEVSPLLFRAVDKNRYFEFVEGQNGNIEHLKAVNTFDKISWYQRPDVKLLSLAVSLLIALLTLLAFCWKSSKKMRRLESSYERSARGSLQLTLLTWLLFTTFFAIEATSSFSTPAFPFNFPSVLMKVTLAIGVAASLLSLITVYFNINIWSKRCWTLPWRLIYSTCSLAIIVILGCLNSYHLIGFNYY